MDTGKNKVRKICEVLRHETLEPAKKAAAEIIQEAEIEAERIVKEARHEKERLLEGVRQDVERQKNIFQASLNQACKQSMLALKQNIEEKLFNQELHHQIIKHTRDPKALAQLITVVVKAIEKEGIDANLSVYVPAAVPARAVNVLLINEILAKLREKSVLIGKMAGGIEVKLHKDNITIDISDDALKELVANYIRKDFREIVFGYTQTT